MCKVLARNTSPQSVKLWNKDKEASIFRENWNYSYSHTKPHPFQHCKPAIAKWCFKHHHRLPLQVNLASFNLLTQTSVPEASVIIFSSVEWTNCNTIFHGGIPLMEGDLQWKTTFNRKWPLMAIEPQWKTPCEGIQPSIEDNLWWNMTFNGRQPLKEDKHEEMTTFNDRWSLP